MNRSIKAELLELVQNLPENGTCDDLQYQLDVRARVERAEDSIARAGSVSHAEPKERLARRLAG